MARQRGRRAWLIEWQWVGEHAAVDRPVIALFPPRTAAEKVRSFVELYYAATTSESWELLRYLRDPDANPYRVQFDGIIVEDRDGQAVTAPSSERMSCGHNPFIVARRVTNLRETVDPNSGERTLSWDEVPLPDVRLP